MEYFAAIEQLAIVKALQVSFYVYPLLSALHVVSVGALVTCVLVMDLRLLGAFASVSGAPFVALLRRIALLAFAAAVTSGLLLFSVQAREYAAMPLFLLKMTLVGLAVVNFAVHMRLVRQTGDVNEAVPGMRAPILVSMLIWPAVLICGRFLGFM